MTLIAETAGAPLALAEPVRRAVHALAPNLPLFAVRTFHDLYDQRSVKIANVLLTLVGSLGLIGLGLALIGLYAVVAYQVSRRTREIGIRMAIGASKRQVMKMVMRHAGILAGVGVAVGPALSITAGKAFTASLQIPPFDMRLVASVLTALLLVTLAAALIPARRAALIDPMRAIRQD
jgi:ABC-type antimicrobial peptide transport system permease subunit